MRAAVFLNGTQDPPELLRETAARSGLVIAADGGARHALEVGVIPDLVVGDMDSLGEDGVRRLEESGAVLERHPVEKDQMDGQLAIEAARERGATEADLLCALGGRTSAVFALPHLLLAAERAGLRATVVADWGRVLVVENGSRAVEGDPGDGVSIFPVAGPAGGITLEGLAYPLDDARLEPGDTLGFHNELVGAEARVTVKDGALLVVHETDHPS